MVMVFLHEKQVVLFVMLLKKRIADQNRNQILFIKYIFYLIFLVMKSLLMIK
jgi:hypothetical protein